MMSKKFLFREKARDRPMAAEMMIMAIAADLVRRPEARGRRRFTG